MKKITKEYLNGEHYNGESFEGYVLIKGVTRSLTKTMKPYFSGTLTAEVDIPYKVWDSVTAFATLEKNNLENKVGYVTGTWNEYQGQFSIQVQSIVEDVDGQFSIADFLPVVYNADVYWDTLKDMSGKFLSPEAMNIANVALFENEEVAKLFRIEFAAKSHHDNCPSGLLAHTYKVCYLMQTCVAIYGGIVDKNLLYLGALLHDIGKIREMNYGAYQPCSKVTHRFLGIEMLPKDLIVQTYGEDWYYELVSIMLQHHGEWGDPCKTVSARIVNIVDEMEAKMQLLKQKVELSDGTGAVNVDGAFLSYMV